MSTTPPPASNDEDLDLVYTREIRKKLIESMTPNSVMPSDNKDRAILLAALSDIDRSALSRKKIKSDEGISNSQTIAATAIAQLFMNPDFKKLGKPPEGVVGQIPTLCDSVLLPELVLGELDASAGDLTYATFMAGDDDEPILR